MILLLHYRIITHEGLTEHVVAGSARVVKFDKDLGLSYNMVSETMHNDIYQLHAVVIIQCTIPAACSSYNTMYNTSCMQ